MYDISSCRYAIETSIFLERQCTLGMVVTPVISDINSPQPIWKWELNVIVYRNLISQCPWVIYAADHIYAAARTCPRSLRSYIPLEPEFIKCCTAQGHVCTQTNNLQINYWLALLLQVYTTCTGWTISSLAAAGGHTVCHVTCRMSGG